MEAIKVDDGQWQPVCTFQDSIPCGEVVGMKGGPESVMFDGYQPPPAAHVNYEHPSWAAGRGALALDRIQGYKHLKYNI